MYPEIHIHARTSSREAHSFLGGTNTAKLLYHNDNVEAWDNEKKKKRHKVDMAVKRTTTVQHMSCPRKVF